MKFPIIIGLVVVVIIIFLLVPRECFTSARMSDQDVIAQIKDMVDNKLTIIQFRAKYGNSLSPLKVSYLAAAYKNSELTQAKVQQILALWI